MATRTSYIDTHQMAGNRVDIDLTSRINELKGMLAGHGRRSETVYKEEGLTVVLIVMEAGNVIPANSAPGTSTLQVLEGRVKVTSDGETAALEPACLAAFAPNVSHDVRASEASVVLLTVTAIAEDTRDDEVPPPRGPAAS